MSTERYSMLLQWSDEDQAYLVRLPEWEDRVLGPVTHGATYEEALANGKDALDALIASARKHGEALPEPHTYSAVDRAGCVRRAADARAGCLHDLAPSMPLADTAQSARGDPGQPAIRAVRPALM